MTRQAINPTPLTPWAARGLARGQSVDMYDLKAEQWVSATWVGHAGGNSGLVRRDGSPYNICVCYAWLRVAA